MMQAYIPNMGGAALSTAKNKNKNPKFDNALLTFQYRKH
jgi:hypothetical protein